MLSIASRFLIAVHRVGRWGSDENARHGQWSLETRVIRHLTLSTWALVSGVGETDDAPTGGIIAKTGLTPIDLAQNSAQAVLKGIPFIGESLSQFIFGPLQDIRWHRLEQTLGEIGEAVKKGGQVDTEEFVALLEKVGPQVARETNEQRRRFFRDLLISAAKEQSASPKWADANLAADLIGEIEPPGLAILAAVGSCVEQAIFLSSQPSPRVFDGSGAFTEQTDTCYLIDYGWPVVEEWVHRLRERRLVGYGSSDARGGFGAVRLTGLGQFLVQWGMRTD